jgi:hypothetical protein
MSIDGSGVITAVIGGTRGIDALVDGRNLVMTPTTDGVGAIVWDWSGSVGAAFIPKK